MQSSSYDGIHPCSAVDFSGQGFCRFTQSLPGQDNPQAPYQLHIPYAGLIPSTLRVIFCFCQQKQSVLRGRMRLLPVPVRARRDRTQESHHTALYFNQNSDDFPSRELNNNILQNKILSLMSRQLIYSLICLRGTFPKP